MTMQQVSRRRRLLGGGAIAVLGSLGLAAFPLSNQAGLVSDAVFLPAVFGLSVITALGIVVAVFSLR